MSDEEDVVSGDGSAAVDRLSEGSYSMDYDLPQFKAWNQKRFFDYDKHVFDYEDLQEVNQATNEAITGLFRLTEMINQYEARERHARTEYERVHRRLYLNSSARTDSARKASADLLAEEYEDKFIVYDQVTKELVRTSNTLRLQIQTLQAISNNLRAQMKVAGELDG